MKTITFHPHGDAYSDAFAEDVAREFLLGPDDNISVSTESFILAVRVLIGEGVIPHDEVQFVFNDEIIAPDCCGNIPKWPNGFCDHALKLLERIVRARFRTPK